MEKLSGKLQYFCPSLFNSLTLWENNFVDSAPILDSFSEAKVVSRDGTLTLGFESSQKHVIVDPRPSISDKVNPMVLPGIDISTPNVGTSIIGDPILKELPSSRIGGGSPLKLGIDLSLQCCREPKLDDEALLEFFDSLIPTGRGINTSVSLPLFLGKAVLNEALDGECASSLKNTNISKDEEFVWSRGLGIEVSPIKTRSSRKKRIGGISNSEVKESATMDSGALRALKALARSK